MFILFPMERRKVLKPAYVQFLLSISKPQFFHVITQSGHLVQTVQISRFSELIVHFGVVCNANPHKIYSGEMA